MIAIYITIENMTAAQHAEGRKRLREAGARMKLHSVFGEEGNLQVFDIWGSRETFDTFLGYLVPIPEELGMKLSAPANHHAGGGPRSVGAWIAAPVWLKRQNPKQ